MQRERTDLGELCGDCEAERPSRYCQQGRSGLGGVIDQWTYEIDAAAPAGQGATAHRRPDRGLGEPAGTEDGGGDDSAAPGRLVGELQIAGFRPVRDPLESTGRKPSATDAFRPLDLGLVATGRKP